MAYELKTKVNEASPKAFIENVDHAQRKMDALVLLDLFEKVTGQPPKMWGDSIVGYGTYSYTYASGHSGDWMATGFSPRKQNLSLYILGSYPDLEKDLKTLGKHKRGKSCLYINKLADIDLSVLEHMIKKSFHHVISTQSGC